MQIQSNQVVTVFKNENTYSIGIMKKDTNGEKQYASILANFRKGVELENKTKIVINNAWLSFYKNQEGKNIFYVFIENFTKVEEPAEQPADQKDKLPF